MNIDWDGKGLPPVGVTCERRFDDVEDSNWQRMTVIAYGKRKVFYSDKNGDEWGHFTSELEFRPFETKERKAELQRERDADELAFIATGHRDRSKDCWISVAKVLLDAGYRKFEIVEEEHK